jgi:hypothetical protein
MNRTKGFLFAFFLLVSGLPLFASDDGGDPNNLPSYGELVREGYGPRAPQANEQVNYYSPAFLHEVPKPTQAYYMKGATIYYGYQTVPVWERDENSVFAFGHPLSYFHRLMQTSATDTDLSRYVLEVKKNNTDIGVAEGSYAAQIPIVHHRAVTRVQTVTTPARTAVATSAPNFRTSGVLPPIAEKPSN